MILYAVLVEEWGESTWYECTKGRYDEESADTKKEVQCNSWDDIPSDLWFEEKRLNEVRAMINYESKRHEYDTIPC